MDNGIEDFEEREVTTEDILNGIKSISPIEWEGANYPIISYANRKFLGIEDNEAEKSLKELLSKVYEYETQISDLKSTAS